MAIDKTKRSYWSAHIKNWQASGLSQRAYCAREGINWPRFDYWRRQALAAAKAAQMSKQQAIAAVTLVPIQVNGKATDETIALHSLTGWELRLPRLIDPAWLADVLKRLS